MKLPKILSGILKNLKWEQIDQNRSRCDESQMKPKLNSPTSKLDNVFRSRDLKNASRLITLPEKVL